MTSEELYAKHFNNKEQVPKTEVINFIKQVAIVLKQKKKQASAKDFFYKKYGGGFSRAKLTDTSNTVSLDIKDIFKLMDEFRNSN